MAIIITGFIVVHGKVKANQKHLFQAIRNPK